MRMPGRRFLRRLARPLSRRLFPGAAIMGYHRVADLDWDPLGLAVGTRNFRSQLSLLSRFREIVSLSDLIRRQQAGEPIDKCVVLTFDDGYSDFLDQALPILAEAEVPGTVFVTTGFTGGTFWWEQVAGMLAPGTRGRSPLVIDTGSGETLAFDDIEGPEAAAQAVRTICHHLRGGDPDRVSSVVSQIRDWAGRDDDDRVTGRPLTADQIGALGGESLAEIGAHTVSHGCLGDMDIAAQRIEVERSRIELERISGGPVAGFSYPNGSYSPETPGIVKRAGFRYACASTEGTYRASGDCFLIPRLWVSDIGDQAFEQWLSSWIRVRD